MRAKKYTQNLIYENPLHFFQMLPFYFYMLEKENLRMVIKFKIDKENKFEYLFMILVPRINSSHDCCISVIAIDETHLERKF